MLKTLFLTLLALTIAVGGGAASVWVMLEEAGPVGAVSAGPWTAFPSAGTREADPYSRARFARRGGVPLGPSEGITFTAGRDSNGRGLRRECAYRIAGAMPASRFWTFYAAGPEGALLPPFKRRRAALHSQMVLRQSDNSFSIAVSRHPMPSNWLAVTGEGPMQLVLTLFDTPVASGARVEELSLPRITRTACDG